MITAGTRSPASGGGTRDAPPPSKRRPSTITESEAIAAIDQKVKRKGGRRGHGADVSEIPYTRLGLKIFLAILCLTVMMVVALAIFAVVTYPTAGEMHALLGSTASASTAVQSWQNMQTQWFDQVLRLGQVFVFGSVLPLLATVVGYILGERRSHR